MPLATPNNVDSIRAWDQVDIYTGVVGTTLPTDTTTALAVGFTAMGLMSDDELTRTHNVDRNELRAFGGQLVRVKRQAQSLQFVWTALENTHKVWQMANPGSTAVTATGVTTRTVKAQTFAQVAMVIHAVEGTIRTRLVIPKAEIFSDGDSKLGPSGMYERPMTAMVYPDSTGTLYLEITDDIAAASS
jgi:hypothetical protein